jgi:glycosidase
MRKTMIASLLSLIAVISFGTVTAAEERQIEDEIFYEIIVDRYNIGENAQDAEIDLEDPKAYHGGDLTGVISRLDDNVEIGVTSLILSPIMANSEDGFHGYWIEDFTEIEERFGSFEDLEMLTAEAHEREIKIILEFVVNYISEEHPIAQDPSYADWILTEEVDGPDWTDGVVQLNLENPEVQDFIIEAALFWLDETDIDGLSIHAADQADLESLNRLTEELKTEHPDAYLLGDVLDPSADIAQIMAQTELDAIDNYEIGETIAEVFSEPDQSPEAIFDAFQGTEDFQSLIFVDDKYSKRFTQVFAENGRNPLTVWKLALTAMYTSPGTPVLLQGSEVTMYGETAEDSQRLVPFTSGNEEVLEFHNRISSLRTEFPALRHGDYRLENATESFAVFKRVYEDQTMYIALNNGSESSHIDVTDVEEDMMYRGYLEDNVIRANDEGNYRVGIPRESIEVYQLMEDAGYNWLLISFVIGVLTLFVAMIITLERRQKRREKEEAQQQNS